jgi:hypothetical protein
MIEHLLPGYPAVNDGKAVPDIRFGGFLAVLGRKLTGGKYCLVSNVFAP